MKKFVLAAIVLLFTGSAYVAGNYVNTCYSECGAVILNINKIRNSTSYYLIEGQFYYSCIRNGGVGCPYSCQVIVYDASDNPSNPWQVYKNYWWEDPATTESFMATCGTWGGLKTLGFKVGLESGKNYLIKFNIYEGDLIDAQQGLATLCSHAQKEFQLPSRSGGP